MKKLIVAILLLAMLFSVALAEETLPDLSNISAGDVVTFGSYEQNNLRNGLEPIEWIVLDVQDGKALLLSKYGLDDQKYNTDWTDVTWETCTLRTYLNKEFLRSAFNKTEQQAILLTDVDNSDSQGYSEWCSTGGNNTQDYIFLLSYAEANKYLGVEYYEKENADQNMKSRVAPTAYAIAWRAKTDSDYLTEDGEETGVWWLRSPGDFQNRAAAVYFNGSLVYRNVNLVGECIRPAFWLNLNPDI